ncbi:MAG: glycosyltransferase [Desulfarculus sp.]|nr:glycosyltransferase [Desulfarculus sp.]
MRVLALTSLFPNPYRPDLAAFNRQQLSALAGLCRLELVAPMLWTHALAWTPRRPAILPPLPFPVRRPWFWYLPGVKRSWHGRALLRSAWPSLRRAATNLRPQALLATWLFPDGWAGLMASRRLNLPLVVKLHGSDLNSLRGDRERLPFLRQVLCQAAAVVAVSPSLAQAAQELGAPLERLHLVPNGVDQDLFRPTDAQAARRELGLPLAGPLLTYVGWLVPVKGPEVALKALAVTPGAHLAVVGDGPLRPALMALARELGIAGRVIWAGSQPHARVARYLAASDALVLPSLSEGEPNAVLEALSCGRPVVASAVGGVPGLVAEGLQGALAPPGDAPALAAAMARVLGRAWRAEDLAASVAGRSWTASAAALLQVLSQAAQERGTA